MFNVKGQAVPLMIFKDIKFPSTILDVITFEGKLTAAIYQRSLDRGNLSLLRSFPPLPLRGWSLKLNQTILT